MHASQKSALLKRAPIRIRWGGGCVGGGGGGGGWGGVKRPTIRFMVGRGARKLLQAWGKMKRKEVRKGSDK